MRWSRPSRYRAPFAVERLFEDVAGTRDVSAPLTLARDDHRHTH